MAIEYIDGFDTYAVSQVPRRYPALNLGNGNWFMVTGRYGVGSALSMQSFGLDTSYFMAPLTSRMEYYLGFDFQISSFTFDENFFNLFDSSGTNICNVAFNKSNGSGNIYSDFTGDLSNGLVPTTTGTWANFQAHFVISPTVGVVEFKVDGMSVVSLTGQNIGSTDIAGIRFTQTNQTHILDNFWVLNTNGSHSNTWPVGAMVVEALYPTADGMYSQWTPSTGTTHYNLVDETPASDSDYITSSNPGDIDTYTVQSVFDTSSGVINIVHGLQVESMVSKDIPPPANIELLVKSGSTLYTSDPIPVGIQPKQKTIVLDDDPNTTSQWTKTAINSIEIGVKASQASQQFQNGLSRIV